MIQIRPIGLLKSDKGPLVIAGPCSAESEEQVMDTARQLAADGVKYFRAGIWKPRTKPGCFEGIGAPGLEWLAEVKRETGMAVTTEVAKPVHVELALKAGIDILWIGARTSANPFAMQDIADALKGVDVPVMVKNPINPDLELWIGAFERLSKAGVSQLAAIHRGFSTYGEKQYRYAPQWQIPIELRRRYPELPIICDPSHMGGRQDLVLPLAQMALDLSADGLFIEVHNNPSCALSDACQQLTPAMFHEMRTHLVERVKEAPVAEDSSLGEFRKRIDLCDRKLMEALAERFAISREIGSFKKENNMAVLQSERYSGMVDKLAEQAEEAGIDAQCIRSIFEAVHTESIRQQIESMESK